MDRLQPDRATDFVALPRAIVDRRLVGDDTGGNDQCAGRNTTGPRPERLARHRLRHRGTMADHVVDAQVVGWRAEVREVVDHPAQQRRVVTIHATVHHPDPDALPGESGGVGDGGVGQLQMLAVGRVRREHYRRHRRRCCRRRIRRTNIVAATTATRRQRDQRDTRQPDMQIASGQNSKALHRSHPIDDAVCKGRIVRAPQPCFNPNRLRPQSR